LAEIEVPPALLPEAGGPIVPTHRRVAAIRSSRSRTAPVPEPTNECAKLSRRRSACPARLPPPFWPVGPT